MTTSARMPLAGIKVLDLSRILAGPFCTQVLADLGADVVKVERPGTGDDTREWGPPFVDNPADPTERGPSAYFLSCNRGKRSIVLDLAKPAGREVLDDLIRAADVLLENFLPEAVAKLGLGPERLKQLNPRLVSCSISGFGRTGPGASTPGYDLAIQACAGLMSITGEPDGMPMKVGVAITDVLTGLYAAVSVLAGLVGREQGRPASGFDLALADCTLAALVNVAQSALVTGRRPQRFGNAHAQIVPYEALATADGHLVLAVGADRQWERFCRAVGHDDWFADPRFATNPDRVAHRDALIGLLVPLFKSRSTDEWVALLTAAEVPHARIAYVDEVLTSPQTASRKMVQTVRDEAGRELQLLGNPIHWSGRPDETSPPPELGRHTAEILAEWLNYSESRIAHLQHDGVTS
jgi:crotonobetainyl-CoA:carnitine CoA-transferase CaiB-like acyl-CoA transferase